jgi:predicted methyltransferase
MLACIGFLVLAPGAALAQAAPDYAAVVASPDRSDTDREIDKRRNPVKLLAFTGVGAGMKVLDMGAGGGYSSELMARAVGASGVVYAHNAADLAARAKERFEARIKTPAMANVVALVGRSTTRCPPTCAISTSSRSSSSTTTRPIWRSIAPR